MVLKKYSLNSQVWSPVGVVTPKLWQNGVDIYIPDLARQINALVVINNGFNKTSTGTSVAPTNFSEENLAHIATATKTIVISVSNVPNQLLSYYGITTPLAEDDSVAYSWKLFMEDPHKFQVASLHIPMAASVSQAFRLAKQELKAQNINKFIVTGVSRRGWAAWLVALSDPDVSAVIPFAMDLLSTKKTLEHMYLSYGKNWPVAFYPYYKQGIDKQLHTKEFAALMTLEDPLAYLNSEAGNRLSIDKYIINASGDDFYVPDNSRFYYEKLPGAKSLRVVSNTTHNGIISVANQSLISFVNRFQNKKKPPEITEKFTGSVNKGGALMVKFSEKPVKILQWTAKNPAARDFRYACDIKYSSVPVNIPGNNMLTVPLLSPAQGWQATYIEATFNDGYVATTQVYITPDEKYPNTAPPAKPPACQTLAGREMMPSFKP